jgi:putative transposase
MDFIQNQLEDARSYRCFNVINDFNREGLAIDIDCSLPAIRVTRSLSQIIEWRGKAKQIHCDNRPEYISGLVATWAEQKGIELLFIQPVWASNKASY